MNKEFLISIFRALCAIAVGALLVRYREQTVTGITMVIGAIFFFSGLLSILSYYASRRQKSTVLVFDAQGNPVNRPTSTFPVVGLGSAVLGGILVIMPNTFMTALMYVLAAILILGALNQYVNLIAARRWATIGLAWWVMPTVVLLVGILALAKPSLIAAAPLFVIGWCMMAYGAVEIVNTIKLYRCRRAFEEIESRRNTETEETEEAEEAVAEAEVVEDQQEQLPEN